MLDRTAGKDGYDVLENTKFLTDTLEIFKIRNPHLELEIKSTESIVYVNEYGQQFKSACQ